MKYIDHSDFVQSYKNGSLSIKVDQSKAGNFILSQYSKPQYKLAHNIWSWLGILLTVPVAIALLFVNWLYAIVSFVAGIIIVSAARKSAAQFVVEQMIDNEDFWNYVLLHKGAKIQDNKGEDVSSEWLNKMANKVSSPN